MPPDFDLPGPGGYAYGWCWGTGDGRVLDEIRQAARQLNVSVDHVIFRVLEALDRKGEPVEPRDETLHRLYRYRVISRGDEVLSVGLDR